MFLCNFYCFFYFSLGLSHDGDSKNNNTCRDDALKGSVMAPMVSATFHHFLWSECSRKEFAAKVRFVFRPWVLLSYIYQFAIYVVVNGSAC